MKGQIDYYLENGRRGALNRTRYMDVDSFETPKEAVRLVRRLRRMGFDDMVWHDDSHATITRSRDGSIAELWVDESISKGA